jgi:cell division septal protein FtsQ
LLVILGRESLNARMDRFVSAYAQNLHRKKKQMLSIDARYRNGVAVMWANEPLRGKLVTAATNETVGGGHK